MKNSFHIIKYMLNRQIFHFLKNFLTYTIFDINDLRKKLTCFLYSFNIRLYDNYDYINTKKK